MADFHQFKSGRQFGAWLGIVPRQNSSGGKANLGRITKRGDDYLRMATALSRFLKSESLQRANRISTRDAR